MHVKTLIEWLDYYEALHPVGIDMGLERVAAVWRNLCVEYSIDFIAKQQVIAVAGTNGKGSACQMLSMLLSAQGHQVGMYTSPHIHRFNERVKINGQEVDDKLLIKAFAAIEQARGEISLSYFEATTLAGLLVFAWQGVDFAVLEVGLGGRLDAINIIDADAALITSIALDHEAFLGNDLAIIALEKMGVCRPNKLAVYAQPYVYSSVIDYADEHQIHLICRDDDYQVIGRQVIMSENTFDLPNNIVELGNHQISNAAGVIVLLGNLKLLPDNYAAILSEFFVAGRLQTISTAPDVIIDVAHNDAAAKALAEYLLTQKPNYQHIYAVVGMLRDKNHSDVFAAFKGVVDAVFCGRTESERSFSDSDLADCAKQQLAIPVNTCGSLDEALSAAKIIATDKDLIVAFGSFLVAEALMQ